MTLRAPVTTVPGDLSRADADSVFLRTALCVALPLSIAACGGAGDGRSASSGDGPDAVAQTLGVDGEASDPDEDSTTDPDAEETAPLSDATALELISTHPDLGQLARAVLATGLVDYLSAPGERTTVFAPSDAAFDALSAVQRDRLLDDPVRLERFLRRGLVDGRVVTTSSAGLGLELDSSGDSALGVGLVDGVIRVERLDGTAAVVASALSSGAAIHVVDDIHLFTDRPGHGDVYEVFEPDPGSLAAALETVPPYARFAEALRLDPRLHAALGDVERAWTALVPSGSLIRTAGVTGFRVADHVVENLDPDAFEGTVPLLPKGATSVSGNRLDLATVGDAVYVNGVEVTEADALRVARSAVHEVGYVVPAVDDSGAPIGVASVLELLDLGGRAPAPEVLAPTCCDPLEPGAGNDPDAYAVRPTTPYLFFAALVRASGLEAEYDDRSARRTLLIPGIGISREEIESRFDSGLPPYPLHLLADELGSVESGSPTPCSSGDCDPYDELRWSGWKLDESSGRQVPSGDRWPGVFRRWQMLGGTASDIVPEIFPDESSARDFLLDHTLEARLTVDILERNTGAVLQTASGKPVAVGGEAVDDDEARTVDDQDEGGVHDARGTDAVPGLTLGDEPLRGEPLAAFNGSIVPIEYALAPTPDVFGVADLRDPPDGTWIEPPAPPSPPPTEDDDSTLRAIEAEAGLSEFLSLVEASAYAQGLQDASWNPYVVFAPTDPSIDPAVTTLAAYVHTGRADAGPFSVNTGPVPAGTYDGSGAEALSFTVDGQGDALTVNGLPARYVETTNGGALYVYGEGALTPNGVP